MTLKKFHVTVANLTYKILNAIVRESKENFLDCNFLITENIPKKQKNSTCLKEFSMYIVNTKFAFIFLFFYIYDTEENYIILHINAVYALQKRDA